jgi:hypothetical protein
MTFSKDELSKTLNLEARVEVATRAQDDLQKAGLKEL